MEISNVPSSGCRTPGSKSRVIRIIQWILVVLTICFFGSSPWSHSVSAQEREPIASTGHGGFFDQDGRQIPVSLDLITRAQVYYRARLLEKLSAAQRSQFASLEQYLLGGLAISTQDQLLLKYYALEWLLANTQDQQLKLRTSAKVRALRSAMRWKMAQTGGDLSVPQTRESFKPHAEVPQRIRQAALQFNIGSGGAAAETATDKKGQEYIDQCMKNGVPIPPTINDLDPAGLAGWKSQGFIPQADQFIVGTPAELRSFTSADGMCFALPRYTDAKKTTVMLDGVICLGRNTSKACFWDNQWTVNGVVDDFVFGATELIPIGVPTTKGGKYQAGGDEIEFGPGGVCTDCHAGENPYIIHPNSDLDPGPGVTLWSSLSQAPQNLPTKSVNRYDPFVGATWPQNQWSQAGDTVPVECSGCHIKPSAGRFPHLSNQLPDYCSIILPNAYTRTMPPGAPGSASAVAAAFRNTYCNLPPDADTADTGDPHISTVNGINYDFQAAGEFTVLRNSESSFELQARQSPVFTTFVPGANPHTGLASCVSLNTAVAMRVGKRRITYQRTGQAGSGERLVLRVDGVPVSVPKMDLGGGNVLLMNPTTGEVEVRLADGTRVVVAPLFWASQGYWYLDLQVFNTPARLGVMGPIVGSDWLPKAPNGASFGPKPASLLQRHIVLNGKFADAWRVTNASTLFDYAPGTSTATFTDRNWPAEPGKGCTGTTVPGPVPTVRQQIPLDIAKRYCAGIKDKGIMANCIFDVTVMGDPAVAQGHIQADKRKQAQ